MNPIRVGVLFEGDWLSDTVSDERVAAIIVPGSAEFEAPRDCGEFAAYFAVSDDDFQAVLLSMSSHVNGVAIVPDEYMSEVIEGIPAAFVRWRRPLKKGDKLRLNVQLRMRQERQEHDPDPSELN